MFETMRKIFGPAVVGVIIGAIAMVFVFYGVFNPKNGGRGGATVAATVNGETIPVSEFAREYQSRVEMYQSIMQGKVDMKMLKQLGLRQQIMEGLVQRKLLLQEARAAGASIGDEEVAEKIQELPYFKDKAGKFDSSRYKEILKANRSSAGAFEDSMREDLVRTSWAKVLRGRAKITDTELRQEFNLRKNQRQVDYVLVSVETAKKQIAISDKDVDALLKDATGLASAKAFYDGHRSEFAKPRKENKPKKGEKPKPPAPLEYYSFEDVKQKVAASLLRDRKADQAQKMAREIAQTLLEAAKKNPGSLSSQARAKGAELKTSDKFSEGQGFVTGLGEASELIADAFKGVATPKLYDLRGNWVLVTGVKGSKPVAEDFAKERDAILTSLQSKKEQEFFVQWLADARARSKVEINKAVEQESESDVE